MENNSLWDRIKSQSQKTETVIRSLKGSPEPENFHPDIPAGNAEKQDFVDKVISRVFSGVTLGNIDISRVQSYRDYPFEVENGKEMTRLADDIKKNGMELPVLVRKIKDPRYDYEMLDGHRRAYALKKLGTGLAAAYIFDCSDEEAAVVLCESNLSSRSGMKLSEQAAVYGMELEALKKLVRREGNGDAAPGGRTGGENTTRAMLAGRHGLSPVNMSRIIRLSLLEEDLLKSVDEKKLPFNVAVALTHLSPEEQRTVYKYINRGLHLSLNAASRLKKEAQARLEPMSEEDILRLLESEISGLQTLQGNKSPAKSGGTEKTLTLQEAVYKACRRVRCGDGPGEAGWAEDISCTEKDVRRLEEIIRLYLAPDAEDR